MSPSFGQSDPRRFRVRRSTLRIDTLMRRFIRVVGVSILLTVFALFFFILAQVLPLFQSASVEPMAPVTFPTREALLLGVDERGRFPFLLDPSGTLHVADLATSGAVVRSRAIPALADEVITVARWRQNEQTLLLGTASGKIFLTTVRFRPNDPGPDNAAFALSATTTLVTSDLFERGAILDLHEQEQAFQRLRAILVQEPSGPRLLVQQFQRPANLINPGELQLRQTHDLSALLESPPVRVRVTDGAQGVAVVTADHRVHFLLLRENTFAHVQSFHAFPEEPDAALASMDEILGKLSLAFTSARGTNVVWTLVTDPATGERRFHPARSFPDLPEGAHFFAHSPRNRAFLLGSAQTASLRYMTTEDVRWQAEELPFTIAHAAIGARYDLLLFLDDTGVLHPYRLDDPHPEAGFRAFFGKLWYEGHPEPSYAWQSTGGSAAFEPKLSLLPLLLGSGKGALFALLFAIPVALLAAIYTSQYLPPRARAIIKPAIEMMASLPSVILGFLGAIWLAPLLDNRMPSVLLAILMMPLATVLLSALVARLPGRARFWIPPGREWMALLPLMVLVLWIAWQLGPVLEAWLFTVPDGSGGTIADFRLWWPTVTGTPFEQRNAVLIGFILGFAVIPTIFTLADDALSHVPATLVSGSLALGASRWETTARVVLPIAFSGLLSALLIGFGRAIGETMIVVMATGNTPILELNPFSGMRSLAANIAIELPEAPTGTTLYHTLFLGALVLFVITFVVNTMAELLRSHLRKRYALLS